MDHGAQAFWDRVARRYAEMPMRNLDAYRATLEVVRQYLQPEHDVLELGCGTGTTALKLAGDVRRYVATDYAPEMIAIAKEKREAEGPKRLELQIATMGDGSLPEGPFDAILAFNLVHLWPDRAAAFSEVLALLPEGGLFISKTPCLGGMYRVLQPVVAFLRWRGKAPDLSFVTPKRLQQEMVRAGFEIVETGDYPRRPPSHLIVARKPCA